MIRLDLRRPASEEISHHLRAEITLLKRANRRYFSTQVLCAVHRCPQGVGSDLGVSWPQRSRLHSLLDQLGAAPEQREPPQQTAARDDASAREQLYKRFELAPLQFQAAQAKLLAEQRERR